MIEQPNFAQDPDELFDVVNEDGSPAGIVKRRADVHRDGDWHRAIHVWVYGVDEGGPHILFNRRGLLKDTFPGLLDVTVGGHLAAGEGVDQAFREIHEEIGVEAETDRLRFLVTRKAYGEVERELQDVFLYRDDRPLAEFRPNPAELEGLVRLGVSEALALFSGVVENAEAQVLCAMDGTIMPFTISRECLLPEAHWSYYRGIAEAVRNELTCNSPGT